MGLAFQRAYVDSLTIADRIACYLLCAPQDPCRLTQLFMSPPWSITTQDPSTTTSSHGAAAARAPANFGLWQSKFWTLPGGSSLPTDQQGCHPEEHAQESDKAHTPAQIWAFHSKYSLKPCSRDGVGHTRRRGCCQGSRALMGLNCPNQPHPPWHPCPGAHGCRGTGEKGN